LRGPSYGGVSGLADGMKKKKKKGPSKEFRVKGFVE